MSSFLVEQIFGEQSSECYNFKLSVFLLISFHTDSLMSSSVARCFFVLMIPFLFIISPFIFAGCGRFFEGNAADMDFALNEKLGSLPDDTVLHSIHSILKPLVQI